MADQTDSEFLRELILFYDMFDGHSNRLDAIADRLEAVTVLPTEPPTQGVE